MIRVLTISLFYTAIWAIQPACAQNWYGFSQVGICFASPSAHDLTNDGVADIVLGAGTEGTPTDFAIIALDGVDGDLLWSRRCRSQIYTQPLYHDLNTDGWPDVVIGGREAQLYALDGRNGNLIWEFFPDSLGNCFDSAWYNFYSPQWIDDQTGDGLPEILVSNGGYPPAQPGDSIRPPGYLLVVNAANGGVLARDTMPDGQEIYYSPQVIRRNGSSEVFFGSGGERTHGKFWHIALDSVLAGNIQQAQPILSGSEKGFIAVASWVHLTADSIADVVVPDMNGRFVALDGATLQPLWEVVQPGAEAYVSPVVGNFNGDSIDDVFLSFALGVFPFYSGYLHLWVDGATGTVIHQKSTTLYQLCAPSVADWDNDGIDDIVWLNNIDLGFTVINYHTQLTCWQWHDSVLSQIPLDSLRPGLAPYSQVLLTDLDMDQQLDLIYTRNLSTSSWYAPGGYGVHRLEFANIPPDRIAWAGYLGPDGSGIYTTVEPVENEVISIYPNPAQTEVYVAGNVVEGTLTDLTGRLCATLWQGKFEVSGLESGVYICQLKTINGLTKIYKIIVD